uniref:Uncharacterized protein n=1 Tax=Kalanchoe fedtschenkoi TaxID=63787 RepID=A0A7N0TTL7_KALFE
MTVDNKEDAAHLGVFVEGGGRGRGGRGSSRGRGRGAGVMRSCLLSLHKPAALAATENNHKEGTTLQKSALKSIKDEADMTPKTSTKRKHDEENKSESKDYGEELSFNSDEKRHKVLYADSNSKDDSKAVAKAKTDSSKEEGKSKVEIGKKLGRPRADVSKSASRSKSDEPSTDSAGKSKVEVEDVQSSGKSKRGDSKTIIKGKSDSKTASKAEAEITSIKQKGPKGKATKSGDETPVTKTAGKMKTRESSKSKSGFAINEDTSKFQAICVLQLSHIT